MDSTRCEFQGGPELLNRVEAVRRKVRIVSVRTRKKALCDFVEVEMWCARASPNGPILSKPIRSVVVGPGSADHGSILLTPPC